MTIRAGSVAFVLAAMLARPAAAEEPAPAEAPRPKAWSDLGIRISPLVTMENHGYFRFRFNELYRMDLGSGGASGYGANLDSQPVNKALGKGRSNVESANLRLRYEPSLRVGEFLTIHLRLDLLDNLVMGQTPQWGSTASPFPFFSRTQVPPPGGIKGVKDAISVRAAYADLRVFERLHLVGGRMPEKFGLGILRSDGSAPDSDFGDSVDAIYGRVNLSATYFRLGMEWPGEGLPSTALLPERPFGYPYDVSQADDIMRWVFVFDSSPVEKEDFDAMRRRLDEERKPRFDWGMYHSITKQDLSADRVGGTLPPACGTGEQATFGQTYDCFTLTPRGSFFWTPALWGRMLYHPRPDLAVRLEAEWVMVYGHVNYMQSFLDASKESTRKDFLEFGAALEAEVDWGPNRFSLFGGVASGDDSSGNFGVIDRSTLAVKDDTRWSLDPAVKNNAWVRNYAFNRDYRLDSILFREVIGAVTNAFYFKPAYRRVLYKAGQHELGLGASLVMGFAMEPAGTPGGKRPLGVEGGLKLDYRLGRNLLLVADGAALFPLAGLKRAGQSDDPRPAAALRTMLWVGF